MRRLLVYFARVGDLVIFTPVIRHLARDADVDLLVRPWGIPLLTGQPHVGAIHTMSNPNRGGILSLLLDSTERQRLATALHACHYDEIITFKGENPAILSWIESWRGNAALRFISRTIPGAPRHNVDANSHALAFGGYDITDYDPLPRLAVSEEQRTKASARLAPLGKRVIAAQAGSSLTHRWFRKQPNLKGLTPQQWSEFIKHVFTHDHADAVVLHGSAPERREAQAIIQAVAPQWRDQVHDWTGQVPLSELPSILAASSATVSVDTGPAHIAAAVGCPLLVIFGPTDPALFAPRGPGSIEVVVGKAPCQFCHGTKQFKRCRANICLNTLAPTLLTSAFDRLMNTERKVETSV
jgi:heptosyltransferase-2/heptosyltransferase-3